MWSDPGNGVAAYKSLTSFPFLMARQRLTLHFVVTEGQSGQGKENTKFSFFLSLILGLSRLIG
jgi:hypothetical protein